MKKLFLSLVAVIVAATTIHAQDVYVATLNHEGTITEYYGATAFQNAYNAAVDGDVITLSAGVFTVVNNSTGSSAVTLNKAIIVRGNGIDNESPTTISGRSFFENSGMTYEGIIFTNMEFDTVDNATFIKCRFKDQASNSINQLSKVTNSTFTNCVIGRCRAYSSDNLVFNNCYIYIGSTFENSTLFNCIVRGAVASNAQYTDCSFTNCVIATNVNMLASNKIANCIGISTNTTNTTDVFKNIVESINSSIATTTVFNSWSDVIDTNNLSPESFELSDEGKAYLGVDGTQVGMLGGNYPYNPIVSIPRITKCEVAEKATADGKLSVNIEVTAPTE